MKKLKERWGISSNWQVVVIFIVFGLIFSKYGQTKQNQIFKVSLVTVLVHLLDILPILNPQRFDQVQVVDAETIFLDM